MVQMQLYYGGIQLYVEKIANARQKMALLRQS